MAITAEELLFKISTQVGGTVAVGELARSFLDLNIKVENLTRGLTAITGSTEKAEETFRYLQDTAQKYGVNLLDLSSGYLKLAAASKETKLEGEATTKIFESLTAAMSVLGADTVSTNRAFVALAQMMSKGQIYAEELRGQLAEALPDAIQVMAKALGVGTDQLYELMQAGALSADVLLPFAYELDKRYGDLSTSTSTFTQELNRLKEAASDGAIEFEKSTGIFAGLTTAIGALADNGQKVISVIEVALVATFVKLTQGMAAATVQTYAAIKSYFLYGVSAQTAAVEANKFAAAQLTLAAAEQKQLANALAISNAALATATANEIAARGTGQHTLALLQLTIAQNRQAAASVASIGATNALTAAQKSAVLAQAQMAAATSLWGRTLSFLTGPIGLVIGGLSALFYVMRDNNEATETLSLSTEEYTKKLEDLSAAEINLINIQAKKEVEDNAQRIEDIKDEIDFLQRKLEAEKNGETLLRERISSLALWNGLRNNWTSTEQLLAETQAELDAATKGLTISEAKRSIGLGALAEKYIELSNAGKEQQAALVESNFDLAEQQKALENSKRTYESLVETTGQYSAESIEAHKNVGIAQEGVIAIEKKRTDQALLYKNTQDQVNNIVRDYIETTGASDEAVRAALSGDQQAIDKLDAKQKAIALNIQTTIRLTEEEKALAAQVRLAKAELEKYEKTQLSVADGKIREAKAIGDLNAVRQAEIEKAKVQQTVAEQTLAMEQLILADKNSQLAIEQQLYQQNEKARPEIQKKIDKLKEEITKQEGVVAQKKANITATEAETKAVILANTLISEALNKQREISAGLQTEIASLQSEYNRLVEAGVPIEMLGDILEQIRLKQEALRDSAAGIDKAMNAAYTAIGLNAEEVMTGMDFDTRRQIDAFGELASSGKLSADDIQRAFTNVLSKANTVDEVEAIKQKLVDLAIHGKLTGDDLAQGITLANTKIVNLRGETDATTKAMEKLGTGVPEQLKAVADELEAAYNVLKRTQAPLDEVQQGFLKYAEAALTAAENGAKIDVAQLKTEASALGLSNAFEELQRKTKEANFELDASIAKNEREQAVLERSIALKEQQREVEEQSIETKKGVAEIEGNLSKIAQAQAELDAKAIEDAQAKIKEMESEIAKTKELIVELEKLQKVKTITPEEAERLKLYQDEVKAKQLIIDKTKEEIPLMVKKAEASAIEAGPLGEAVRLYQAKADAMERNIVAMNEEIKQSQALQQQQVTEEQQALQLLELDKQALVVGAQTLQSEIAAAEAAGDTAKANELKLKLADNLIEQAEQEIKIAEQKVRVAQELVDMAKAEEAAAKKKAAAYQEAAEAMAKLAAATKAKAQADGDYSEEEKKAVATLEAKTAVLKGEVIAQNAAADAAKAAVEAGERQVKIANEGVKAAKAAKEAAEANKEALKDQIANQDKDTDSKKNNTKATKDNTQAAKDRAAALEAARKAAEEAAKAEKERLEAMKKATEDAKKELQDLQIELLDTKGFDKQAAMLQEAANYSKELADLEAERLAATEEGNLDLAKVLKDQIDVLGDIYTQKKKTYQLDLENKEGLRDARLELMGLNAEVLDEQGFAFAAEQLQQQIDYEGQLSDLRQQRLEAEKSGNIELINVLDEQKIVLGQINDLKLASIEQGYLDDIKAIQQEITDVTKEAATERLEVERDYQDELQKITNESKDAKVEAQKDVNEAYDDLIKDSLEASKEYSKSVSEELAAVAESLTEVDQDYAESVADLLEKSAETFADINEAADESLAELVTSIEERTKEAQSTLADSAESLRRELLSAQGKEGEVIAAEFGDQLQELVEQAALAGEAGKEVLNQAIADALELQNLQLKVDKESGELTDSEYSKAKEAIQERVDGLNEILATEQAIIAAKDEADKLKIEDERQAALDLAEQEKTKAQADLEDELIAKKAAIADELVDKLAALDIAHAEELANIQETYTENKASIDQALQDELASIKQARDEKLKDIAADKKEQLNTINEELKLSKEQLTVELDKAKSVMEQTTAQKALNTEMTTTLSISKEIAASFTQISAAQSSITSFLNELETAKKRSF